ncbi:MAG: N-acetyltransferase family protein [Peptococcaceae bacterium]|nr:N-acetyltransferase family protein [Peptococcaceae bacterium]
MNNISIRVATPDDAEALLALYAPYVTDTAISFEYEVPSVEEFRARIVRTLKTYPYLIAEFRGVILGYAYTSAFVGRAAYAWSAETSIYIDKNCRHQGIGRALYQALESISRLQRITNLYACIGVPENGSDPYLTRNSADFHAHLGYRFVGEFQRCGYKFDHWYHMIWMEKLIADHPAQPLPMRPFSELTDDEVAAVLDAD